MPAELVAGLEYNQDNIEDNMWGYKRHVKQNVKIGSLPPSWFPPLIRTISISFGLKGMVSLICPQEFSGKEKEADKASFSLPENSYGQISLTIPLTDKDINAVLINGGNHDGGRLPIIAEFSKEKTVEELGEYL